MKKEEYKKRLKKLTDEWLKRKSPPARAIAEIQRYCESTNCRQCFLRIDTRMMKDIKRVCYNTLLREIGSLLYLLWRKKNEIYSNVRWFLSLLEDTEATSGDRW